MNDFKKNIAMLIIVLALILAALWWNTGAEFAGADDKASDVISEVDPNYTPWFDYVWEPPSGEIASLLFAVQAALGTGFICFYLGYKAGQKKRDGGAVDAH